MKLLYCPECRDSITLTGGNIVRECRCGHIAGKYLKDNVTAVVAEGAIVYGVDNNGLANAIHNYHEFPKKFPRYATERFDFFFSGWVPTVPGEIIRVKSAVAVRAYDYYDQKNWDSSPTSVDKNESNKFKRMMEWLKEGWEKE